MIINQLSIDSGLAPVSTSNSARISYKILRTRVEGLRNSENDEFSSLPALIIDPDGFMRIVLIEKICNSARLDLGQPPTPASSAKDSI